jgi:hypothetical protein
LAWSSPIPIAFKTSLGVLLPDVHAEPFDTGIILPIFLIFDRPKWNPAQKKFLFCIGINGLLFL